jgi:ankyrin repeat protein
MTTSSGYYSGTNHPNSDSQTPLLVALRHGHDHTVRLLLDHAADANYPDSGDLTALRVASQEGRGPYWTGPRPV